jgi:hypothetical protein
MYKAFPVTPQFDSIKLLPAIVIVMDVVSSKGLGLIVLVTVCC